MVGKEKVVNFIKKMDYLRESKSVSVTFELHGLRNNKTRKTIIVDSLANLCEIAVKKNVDCRSYFEPQLAARASFQRSSRSSEISLRERNDTK